MDDVSGIISPFIKQLTDIGLAGLIIAVLLYACWRFYNRNQELNNILIELTKEVVRASESSTQSINRLLDVLNMPRSRE